jgi:HTH-type transcriptional regulator / antitoxin HigA
MTKWKSFVSKADYKSAVRRINEIIDFKRTDAIHNELSLLSFLVEEYEAEHLALPDASPVEVIKFAMEMKGIRQQDLIPVLGTKGNVSKILNGKANIHLEDIQPLSSILGIPVDALIPKSKTLTQSSGILAEPSATYEMSIPKSKRDEVKTIRKKVRHPKAQTILNRDAKK